VFDAHAHVLDSETVRLLQRETPNLIPIDDEFAVFEGPDIAYRPFPRGAWDLERRFADMVRFGIDRQLVTVCPQTLSYGAEPQAALAVAQIQNDQISAMCAAHPRTFAGLATAPMQAPELAANELTRAMRDKGLRGAMVGSNIVGRNLDDPALEPFWAAADELSAFILVHPVHVAGGDRQRNYYLKNIVGNPLDTTIAAACLAFGGVIARYPRITFCMSHGGDFTPYQAGRFIRGWDVRDEPKARHAGHPKESLDRLVYDTILHAPSPLRFLIGEAGPQRVVLGTDYPFDMGQYDIVSILRGLGLDPSAEAEIAGRALERMLAVQPVAEAA
jgi:aminocarboxymuconate-semialdehyde decarboxylase